ncbi:hypothetical protein AAFF_G00079830 [Aldrovandia affinis]|uniref:Uncharacterized protein n=1 Tax=Aldrovandia affinis TaxID=143900 RepID=A0AAD7R1I2_9TELE|nr:hypothetical protein AAFF_G00079830 [Aldrovandia affinis]
MLCWGVWPDMVGAPPRPVSAAVFLADLGSSTGSLSAQEEDRAHKKRTRVEFGTYRPKIGWGSTDQRQNNERYSQTQKDYQSGQAPMQENRHGCGNEDWSGRAEGAGRRGRGQGGWYRPRPCQRQREWMQHCDR